VILIVASFVPAITYAFDYHPHLKTAYLAMIAVFGSAASFTMIDPTFRKPDYRRMRTWIFISLGLSAVLPILHAIFLEGLQGANEVLPLKWLLAEGLLYITSALLYAERVPERLRPGAFDCLGASHQIFHVLIDMACFCHYVTVAKAFRHHHHQKMAPL